MKKLIVRYGLLIITLTGLVLGRVTSRATMLETQAGDYYVDAVGGSDVTGNGSTGSPWQTITHALSQVIGPDVAIHVAAGTYNEALGESFPITMEPNVSLLGAGYTTTIISGNESNNVIHFPSTATYTETTVISGFKITGGSIGVRVDGVGGNGSSPTIRGNWISGNNHGIYNRVASGRRVYTVVRDNLISGNSSHGIYNHADYTKSHANPHVEGNQIINNGSGGIYCYAAAAGDETSYCSPQVINNLISGNGGAGMICKTYYAGACNGQIVGNTIADNQGWGIARSHSGSYLKTSRPKFINNFIFGNTTGGAQFRSGDQPTLVNNTVADNNTYGIRNGAPTIVNCIVWGHTDDLNVSVNNVSY